MPNQNNPISPKTTNQDLKTQKEISGLDNVASKILSSIDPGFSERRILRDRDRRIQEILDNELSLSKGVSNGSIIDFITTMGSNSSKHTQKTPLSAEDASELFTKDITNIFGYFQNMYKNRYVEYTDLQFVSKFIPALGEAVKTTLDSICGSDDMSDTITRNLVFNASLSEDEKKQITSEIERIEKEEKILKKLKNVVFKNALISGQHYIYAPPYKAIFEEYDRLLKSGRIQNGQVIPFNKVNNKNKPRSDKSGFNLTSATEAYCAEVVEAEEAYLPEDLGIVLESSNLFTKEEVKAMKESLKQSPMSIKVCGNDFMEEAIEAVAAIDTLSTNMSSYKRTFGGNGVMGETFYGTSDGTASVNGPIHGETFDVPGTYLEYIKANQMVPIRVYNQVVGYFYVRDGSAARKAKQANSIQENMLVGGANLFANINLHDNKRDQAVKLVVDTISDGILSSFDKKFVNNNVQYKKMIADCLIANGLVNNSFNIQFIPAAHVIPFVVNETEEGIGTSILQDALFPARLLLNLVSAKMLMYMNNSGQKTYAYVRKGPIDVSHSNMIQRTLRQLQQSQITFADLLSTNLSFAKFNPYGNIEFPTARNGDKLVEFETQEGQRVDLKTDFEEWLEKTAIMGTGVPSVIMEYTDAADYAKSIVSGNIKFAARVATFDADFEESATELYKILIANSNLDEQLRRKAVQGFQFKIPRPKVAANANLSDYLSSMQNIANTLADLYMGPDPGEENDPLYARKRDIFVRNTVMDYLPFVDWDSCKRRLDQATIQAIQNKKIPNDPPPDSMNQGLQDEGDTDDFGDEDVPDGQGF